MREHLTKSGSLMYYASRAELEALPGYRGNDRQGRACCPIHDGDNPTALSINWATGWARCFSCGDAWAIRVEDHPDAIRPRGDAPAATPQRPRAMPRRRRDPEPVARDLDALHADLERAIAGAMDALPASPGAAYLDARGTPLDVARELGIGWGTRGALAGRIVFPLCGPDGHPTSAIGRRIDETDDRRNPKYKALDGKAGYTKTLFNGGAIAWAKRSGHPLIVVEGPLDAAACVAAGYPLAVAIGSTTYRHPEHFAGLSTVILALDGDAAGQAGRRSLWLDLTARGIEVLSLPAASLDGAKDLGEYWQRYRAMPMPLAARSIGPHPQSVTMPKKENPHVVPEPSCHLADDVARPEHVEVSPALDMTPDDLPADLRAEAEALALELASDGDLSTDYFSDLVRNEATLSPEDRVAAWYALDLASTRINATPAA